MHKHSVDYVTAAQSFHWFDKTAFKTECRRILRSDGQVVLIWNCRDERSQIVQAVDAISRKYCPGFSGSLCGMRGAKSPDDYKDFFAEKYYTKSFNNPLIFNKESFLGLHMSASYCSKKNDENYVKYIDSLLNFFERYSKNGLLILENNTRCYIGHV